MTNIDNVYSKDGLFVSRQIKTEYVVEKLSIDYDGKKVISKIEEKQSDLRTEQTTYSDYEYNSQGQLIREHSCFTSNIVLSDSTPLKTNHNNIIDYIYVDGKIKRVNNSEGNSNYSQLRHYRIYHFDNNRISYYEAYYIEVDTAMWKYDNVESWKETGTKDIKLTTAHFIYRDGNLLAKKYVFPFHPRYNEGGQYVEIFEYDKNGKLFWNSTWETQLESIEEYGSYSFDYEYEHINDELGEQLVKGYVKKNNSNIATITSNFI